MYLCTEMSEVRMKLCVIVSVVYVVCGEMMKESEKMKPVAGT